MTTLLLIKHAAPVISDRPAREWPLSDAGRAASKRLGIALRTFAPAAIYASDEPKASETARAAAVEMGMVSTVCLDLHEHDQTGTPYLDRRAFEAQVQSLFTHPAELRYGRETGDQARARFSAALQPLLAKHCGETFAVVAHGRVISLYLAQLCRLPADAGFRLWQSLGMPCLVEVELTGAPSIRQVLHT